MNVVGPINSGAAAGGAGVATANANSAVSIHGKLYAVRINYLATPPATTDVTIATQGTSPLPPAQALLTVSNANADAWFYPRAQIDDELGVAVAAEFDHFPLADFVNVLIAQANDGDSVDVWLLVDSSGYM